MKTYRLNKKIEKKDDLDFIVGIREYVHTHDSIGDQIGIDSSDNIHWFNENIDLTDNDIQDFIMNNFSNPIKVVLYIQSKIN